MKADFHSAAWQRGRWLALSLLLGSCLTVFGLAMPVRAATYFFHFGQPTFPPSTCSATGNTVQGPFSINVAAGMTYSMVASLNGTPFPPANGTYSSASSGSGFTYVWGLGYPSPGLPYHFSWAFTLSQGPQWLSKATISFDCTSAGMTNVQVTNIDSGTPSASTPTTCSFPDVIDGRLNPPCDDSAQTAAFYCTRLESSDGKLGLIVYAVWQSKGFYQFHVSQTELDSVPSKPTKNTLVKAGKYVQLWRLTTGELQFDTYTDRVYIFPGSSGAAATFAQMCSMTSRSYYLTRR